MNKKRIIVIISIILITTIISIFISNHIMAIKDFESSNTPEQLESIFSRCACQERVKNNPDTNMLCLGTLIDWQNSTHYIDNNLCKFIPLPFDDNQD